MRQHNGSPKYMNLYRVQYWLYAIFAKEYGASVKMKRDSLHEIYEVNRHGFEVYNIPQKKLKDLLISELLKSGYTHDDSYGEHYNKSYDYEDVEVKVTISIRDVEIGYRGEKGIYVFPMINKKRKKAFSGY